MTKTQKILGADGHVHLSFDRYPSMLLCCPNPYSGNEFDTDARGALPCGCWKSEDSLVKAMCKAAEDKTVTCLICLGGGYDR